MSSALEKSELEKFNKILRHLALNGKKNDYQLGKEKELGLNRVTIGRIMKKTAEHGFFTTTKGKRNAKARAITLKGALYLELNGLINPSEFADAIETPLYPGTDVEPSFKTLMKMGKKWKSLAEQALQDAIKSVSTLFNFDYTQNEFEKWILASIEGAFWASLDEKLTSLPKREAILCRREWEVFVSKKDNFNLLVKRLNQSIEFVQRARKDVDDTYGRILQALEKQLADLKGKQKLQSMEK